MFFVAIFATYSFEPLKIDVVLEEKIIENEYSKVNCSKKGAAISDTIYTYLCLNYDTTSIYKSTDKIFRIFFQEKNIKGFLHKRPFHISEIALADSLISTAMGEKKEYYLYDYKFFSKSLYPYIDENGDYILMVSGYIRYKGLKNSIFPILYHESPDFFLAKINVSKRMIVFFR